jgi:fructokinase
MTRPRIVALGEVLWDLLPEGKMLGGAPANFAFHARALGAESRLVSRVGDDRLGREILQRFSAKGLPIDGLQVDPAASTGTVSVHLSDDGQPNYIIHEGVAWDAIAVTPEAMEMVTKADAICFGSLAQRAATSREAIRALVSATTPGTWRIFDINLRQNYSTRETIETSLGLANVLKLNETELPVLAEMFGLAGESRDQLAALAERFDLRAIALTLGAGGSLLRVDETCSAYAGTPVKVRDTIGAGDSFTAMLALGLIAGWPAAQINERANAIAAFVCSQSGATPDLPEELRAMSS